MLDWTEYAKIFLALMVIVNPVGAVVLIVAAIGGQPLLALFGITISSFKVGGAILILLLAISTIIISPAGLSCCCPA